MEKYKFDLQFQECLLAAMLGDQKFMSKSAGVLRPEYFDDEILQGIAETGLEFFEQRGVIPDSSAVLQEIKSRIAPGRKFGEYRDRIRSLFSRVGTNSGYYQAQALEFARKQAVMEAIREAQSLIEQGDVDAIVPLIQKAVRVGDTNGELVDFFARAKERALGYQKARKYGGNSIRERVVSTGISSLDAVTHGGLGSGELGLVVAPAKHGKSTMLVNLGAAGVLAGKTVLHVTLELRERLLEAKYDSRFFGSSLLDIQKRPRRFLEAMHKLRAELQGKLIIKEFPTKCLTVRQLQSIASDIPGLGLILVDYADLMRPVKSREELRFELRELYENLRGAAGELGVPIWTASQANRPSIGQRLIGMEFVAESSDKVAICDVAFSLCQQAKEANAGQMRLYVMGSRIGPMGIEINCNVNWETSTIVSTEDDLDGEPKHAQNSEKDQRRKRREAED